MQGPLITLFGASNELPQEAELEALFDRFLLRLTVGYVSESGFARLQRLIVSRNGLAAPQTISQAELAVLQQAAAQGRPTDKIGKAVTSVLEMRERIGALILGAM
jgi:MoxR-like ATPase